MAASGGMRAAMASVLVALGCLALVAVHETAAGRRVELYDLALDDNLNKNAYGSGHGGWTAPLLDDEGLPISDNRLPGADEPSRPGNWAWSTTKTADDLDVTNGHGKDWIYQDGWQNPGHALKGPESYYYNEWEHDENMQTSLPYTYLGSQGTHTGPDGVAQILNFDPYLMNSNGIY